MKKRFFRIMAMLSLLLGFVIVLSCDNVAAEDDGERLLSQTADSPLDIDFYLGNAGACVITYSDAPVEPTGERVLFYNLRSSLAFIDVSVGVKGRTWYFEGGTPEVSTEITPDVSFDDLADKNCRLELLLNDDSVQVINFIVKHDPTLWPSKAQGFECDPTSYWASWNGAEESPWPTGTLTQVAGGAVEGSDFAGKIIYNGEGDGGNYWAIITRDRLDVNAQIVQDKTYRISFWAKADNPGTIAYVRLLNRIEQWMIDTNPAFEFLPVQDWYWYDADYASMYSRAVTTEWQYFEKEFTVDFEDNAEYADGIGYNAFPEVAFSGPDPNVFYLDEIKLEQLD